MMNSSLFSGALAAFEDASLRINDLPAAAFHNGTDEMFMGCNIVVLITPIKILNFSG
jgi:hypothetical protein